MSRFRDFPESKSAHGRAWLAFGLSFAALPAAIFVGLFLRTKVWHLTPVTWWLPVGLAFTILLLTGVVLAFTARGTHPDTRAAVIIARIFTVVALGPGLMLTLFVATYGDPG